MSFPFSSNLQDPSKPSSPKPTSRLAREQPSAWGQPVSQQPGARRGLTPLTTGPSAAQARSGTSSPSRGILSPTLPPSNPPALPSGRQNSSRHSSISSSSSLFSPLNAATTSQNRARTGTTTGSPRLGSSGSGGFGTIDRGGGGGALGGSRLARQSPSLSTSTTGSPPSSAGNHSTTAPSQVTSLVITQLNILLSTIKEDRDRTKWEAQAEKIYKLLGAHGMELYTQFFRRLLQGNASHIFGSARNPDGAGGTYQLLVTEIQKLSIDPEQAPKIAESLDSTDGELMRDFDLSTFLDHFRLNPILRTYVALCCKSASKPDLKAKADAILSNTIDSFLAAISDPVDDTISAPLLAAVIDRLVHNLPRNWNDDKRATLQYAIRLRYNKLGQSIPYAIGAALALIDVTSSSNTLIRLLQQTGNRGTATIDAAKDLLAGADANSIGYHQVADALLYMAITGKYDITNFVGAARQHRSGQRLDWQDVVSDFDRQDLRVTKHQFLAVLNALLPIAKEVESFNISSLWGGSWTNPDTQLSFVVAFLSTTQAELDVTQLPNLRTAFSVAEFLDASPEIRSHAAKAVLHPMVSYDATEALFTIIFSSQEAYNSAQSLGVPEAVINANTDVFVCAASAVAKPWTALQEQALKQLLYPFFTKALPNDNFVMHALWVHDKAWLAARFIEQYNQNPHALPLIFDRAQEHHWIDSLIGVRNDFGLDFTALAHSHDLVDIEKWTQDHMDANKVPQAELSRAIIGFLKYKITDEMQVQREADASNETVPLKIKTVYALLNVISGTVSEQEEGAIQRACVQAYPRLINYGYNFDSIIDANGADGNSLSEEADAKMQEQYKDMYSGDADARKMINTLRTLRDSEEPADQELFACMIHGLFDEYNCFGEYPLEALATTAVLFGGIINFGILHSRITLSVALLMVVEAVASYAPEDSMYKFGLQASLHFINRLEEWPQLCERLCRIPGLQGTEVFTKAEEIVKRQAGSQPEGQEQTNGESEDFGYQPFASINIDASSENKQEHEPDEETSDKVTFVLNNVSKRNIEEKFKELQGALEERYHQWFAAYLVENLAKSQPNFQTLYLQLLTLFGRKSLWKVVIHETYVSIAKIMNAEAAMTSSADRTNLKNLATWLGLLTLARNVPILHRNISFKDLLIEAHQTQRLLIALPFTCKTLSQAAKSSIFKPPNPWTLELVGLLMELYHFAELKLNLKFEIEVLCKDLDLDHNKLEPADIIRSLPLSAEDAAFMPNYTGESMDGFGDMLGLSKRSNERLSAQEVMKSIPDFSNLLTFPPPPGNATQQQIRHVFLTATQRALQEIIAPVVDRSVTIAAISAAQLIEKDFAMEPDIERLQRSAHQVVSALSGSLALVTCKEPLRMSIMNNIRLLAAQSLPDQLPEGSIMMFLNDNLDAVCKLVEDSAETHSVAEINTQLEGAVEARKRHRQQRPHEAFNEPPVSRWAFFVPEPYRQEKGGLNGPQLAIYEDFARQARLPAITHGASQDSTRQISDVLSEGFMPTPAEAPALPRQNIQQRMPPTNGYVETGNVAERVQSLLEELQHAAREAPEEHIRDLPASCQTRDVYDQLVLLISSIPLKDDLANYVSQRSTILAFTDAKRRLEIEVLIHLINQLCLLSGPTACKISMFINGIDDERVFNSTVIVCLLKAFVVSLNHVDTLTAKALQQRRVVALDFFSEVIDELLLTEQHGPLRADFTLSLIALTQWATSNESNDKVQDVLKKLGNSRDARSAELDIDQLEFVFEEWVGLQRSSIPETTLAAFISQLSVRVSTREDLAILVRIGVNASVEAFEREAAISGSLDQAYVQVDATAKLIVSLVTYSDLNGLELLEDLLCIVILLMNNAHETDRERFSARLFYRLFSSILNEFAAVKQHLQTAYFEIVGKMAHALLTTQPRIFPGFAFQWIGLLGHRKLMVPLMQAAFHRSDTGELQEIGLKSWTILTKVLCVALTHLGSFEDKLDSPTIQDYYRATLRVFCLIQHDYAEYLAETHVYLNAAIPANMIQLFNIINCANPHSVQELPDPFTPGLKINRLEQARLSPVTSPDVPAIMESSGLRQVLDQALAAKDLSSALVSAFIETLVEPTKVSEIVPPGAAQASLAANALMISLGTSATIGSSTFSAAAPEARLLEDLLAAAPPSLRYTLISAMVNQIRYPSSHTHYFSTALLHLFTVVSDDIQQQLARVLVERLMVARPHPWGLIVTILELVKGSRYNIFEQRWMKAAPEVERMLASIAQTSSASGSGAN